MQSTSEAAIGLGIQSQLEYLQRYKEDERLPSRPNRVYGADWIDWFNFLDKEKRSLYSTYAEYQQSGDRIGHSIAVGIFAAIQRR
ncbi:hypothetical protein OGZ01_00810 [Vibrio harveyi]|nr:hypothetical protein [Vibrio harveyi]